MIPLIRILFAILFSLYIYFSLHFWMYAFAVEFYMLPDMSKLTYVYHFCDVCVFLFFISVMCCKKQKSSITQVPYVEIQDYEM